MISQINFYNKGGPRSKAAFTLIEMIGILAVIAILAVVLLPVLIRHMDQLAADKEVKQLRTFADGLRQQIVKSRSIPDQSTWYSMIASNLGLSTNQVVRNDRRVVRAYLIDPSFQLQRSGESASGPPYIQNAGGSIINPNATPYRPRLMILSSIAQTLPVASGVSSAFNTIWATEDGKVPADSAWNSFTKGDDLKIQRIHLADLFVELVLNSPDGNSGQYGIDGNSSTLLPINRYFLDSSLLELYDGCIATNAGILRYSEILHRSKSFSFISCSWQQGDDSVTRQLERPGPLDLQLAMNAFLSLTNHNPWRDGWPVRNTKPPYVTPLDIHNTMTNYVIRYIDWRATDPGAPSGNQPLQAAQTDLQNATAWLIDPN